MNKKKSLMDESIIIGGIVATFESFSLAAFLYFSPEETLKVHEEIFSISQQVYGNILSNETISFLIGASTGLLPPVSAGVLYTQIKEYKNHKESLESKL